MLSQNPIKVKAYAKINLSLNITGVQDNLHTLDMILASIDLADDITITPRNDFIKTVTYSNHDIKVGEDSVSRALELFENTYRKFGVDIYVEKNIPLASGLGGSGVNATAVLTALQKHFKTSFNLEEMAKQIGSDCMYQLKGGFARVEGVGDKITYFSPNPDLKLHAVVAMGKKGVQSKDAYRIFDEIYPNKEKLVADNDELVKALTTKSALSDNDFAHFNNALTKASVYLNNEIVVILSALYDAGAKHVVMSGSGSACIGFFEDSTIAKDATKNLKDKGLFAHAVMPPLQIKPNL